MFRVKFNFQVLKRLSSSRLHKGARFTHQLLRAQTGVVHIGPGDHGDTKDETFNVFECGSINYSAADPAAVVVAAAVEVVVVVVVAVIAIVAATAAAVADAVAAAVVAVAAIVAAAAAAALS